MKLIPSEVELLDRFPRKFFVNLMLLDVELFEKFLRKLVLT